MTSPAPTLTRAAAEATPALERYEDLDAIRDEWTALAELSGNPFSTWEWAATWWEHFGGDRPLLITGCRRPDGTLAAILPLYLSNRAGLRMARFVGHGVGDVLGPVCAPQDAALAASTLHQTVAEHGRLWDLLLAERMPSGTLSDALPGYVVQEEDGRLGTVCIYEGVSPEAIRRHADNTGMSADEINPVVDTVIVREDPVAV